MKQKIMNFCKKEVVLVVATVLAVASAFVVPPSAEYLSYIDWHVLGILLSLMVVMAGLQRNGLFDMLGEVLLAKTKKVWQLVFVLVALCFFLSMFITNDVALITFVPFAILTLEKSGQERLVIPVVVLQTIAANLGSMLTPIGNPQNLYLYNLSGMSIVAFIELMFPYTAVSFGLLVISMLLLKGKTQSVVMVSASKQKLDMLKIVIYLILFVLAFLVVLKLLPFELILGIVLVVVFFM